jgi:hypothetical protein
MYFSLTPRDCPGPYVPCRSDQDVIFGIQNVACNRFHDGCHDVLWSLKGLRIIVYVCGWNCCPRGGGRRDGDCTYGASRSCRHDEAREPCTKLPLLRVSVVHPSQTWRCPIFIRSKCVDLWVMWRFQRGMATRGRYPRNYHLVSNIFRHWAFRDGQPFPCDGFSHAVRNKRKSSYFCIQDKEPLLLRGHTRADT